MFFWRETNDSSDAASAGAGRLRLTWGFTAAEGVSAAGREAAEVGLRDGVSGGPSKASLPHGRRPAAQADGPYGAFNLGGHVGDDPESVEANRRALAASVGVPRDKLLFMAQVHGSVVERVDAPWADEPPPADGIVTTTPGLALAVLVADCVPVLLADPEVGVVAAVHAGRPGLVAGVVDRALDVMTEAGARRVRAVVGPSVCGRCYEVPSEMRDDVAAVSPLSPTLSWAGTPAVDVAVGVVDGLRRRGVDVHWVPGCTRESERLYSYRRANRTGRFAGVVVLDES